MSVIEGDRWVDPDLVTPAYRELTMAILRTAVRDVQANNSHAGDALAFLEGEWCEFLAESLDIHHALRRRVAELPRPTRQLALGLAV